MSLSFSSVGTTRVPRMYHVARLPRAIPSPWQTPWSTQRKILLSWHLLVAVQRSVALFSSDTFSDNVGRLFPGLYQASNPFKWSQCNRTVSTGMSTPLRRREEEITAGYLLVTTVTNAVVQATILHRHRITFKSCFRPRC